MKASFNFFFLCLLFLFLAPFAALGQQATVPPTTCKTDQIHEDLMINDKAYRNSYNGAQQLINNILAQGQYSKQAGVIYLVPVVVHVIHLGEAVGTGTNISVAQINSAIAALNRDYRRLPDDGGIAMGAGVDTEIQFCLKGINRVNGTSVSGYSSSGITGSNEVSVKALSIWDNCCYINIWSVSEIDGNNGGAGTQGYAYFPGNCNFNKNKDGIVALYNAIGNDPGGVNGYNLKTYTRLGRVLTHEMGHAFDLYHTFAGGSCTETNCNTQGDRCCDTPPHPGANANCATPECAGTQQVQNYEDYTGETCQDMFTQCQANRMRATCAGPRAGLFAPSCSCPPLLALDAGVTGIINPLGTSCGDTLCPEVIIKNFGSSSLTSITINYQIDVSTYTYIWTGSLAPNYTDTILLPCVTVSVGAHTFTSWTSLPNGSPDQDPVNDSASVTFNTLLGTEVTLTLTTDNFGYETYWEVTDCGATVYASGGNSIVPPGGNNVASPTDAGAYASSTTFIEKICIPDACYCFKIYDDFGDGICCVNGSGSYLLQDPFGNTLASGGSFNVSETKNFCVTSVLPVADFSGDNTTICVGDTVTFTDSSTGNITNWSWAFSGGIPATSIAQNPTVVYNTAGTYDVSLTVTNTIGNDTQTFSGYITVNSNPSLSTVGSNVNCTCNGTATVTASGTSPFTYQWNDPASQTSTTATGLCSGTYSVTVIDANGCSSDDNISIIELSGFGATITAISNVSCNGAGDGSATVTASGGVTPYTYLWSNSATTATVSSLSPGAYSVTVTDANGCVSIQNITITEPSVLSATTTAQDAGCFEACNGSATVTALGGVFPYTYQWDDADLQTTPTAVMLCDGSYTVTITDSNGCTTSANATINGLPPIILTLSSTDASCGAPDGSTSVSATGGNSPYTYLWNMIPIQTTDTATGLPAGNYTVMVTDANGCSVFGDVSVNATGGPVASISSSVNVNCNGVCIGSATVSVTGGAAPLTYLWSDASNQTNITATGLCARNYSVRVTDSNGCISNTTVTITEPPALNISISDSVDVSCNLSCDGSATVTAVGGTGTYTYSWTSGQNTALANSLCAGNYSVTVTDANSCSAIASVNITEPPPLTVTTTASVTPCSCPCAGVVRAFPAGGTPPYSVVWSNGSTDKYLSKLCDGTYFVTVTDANGCTVVGNNVTITN